MEADPEGRRPCPQNVRNLCSICPQFIPWRQIWNKFGTNWGHSAGHSRDTHEGDSFYAFLVPRGRQRDTPKHSVEHFWATCGNTKASLPPLQEHHFEVGDGYYSVTSGAEYDSLLLILL